MMPKRLSSLAFLAALGNAYGADNSLEEVLVKATKPASIYSVQLSDYPAAQTTTALVSRLPSASLVGQGGHFQGISVRGASRQRVAWRILDVPIRSERRAGATLSFLNPAFVSEYSLLAPDLDLSQNGSIGGTVTAMVGARPGTWWQAGYNSFGNQAHVALTTNVEDFTFGGAFGRGQNDQDPEGNRLNIEKQTKSAFAQWSKEFSNFNLDFTALSARDTDFGKSSNDFPTRETRYPRDRHNLAHISLEGSRWRGHLYSYDNLLLTEVTEAGQVENVRLRSEENGAGVSRILASGPRSLMRLGLRWHQQRSLSIQETTSGETVDARGDAYGLDLAYTGEWTEWDVHSRISFQLDEQEGRLTRREGLFAGAFKVRRNFGANNLTLTLSRSFRNPSFSELFFSGITGRGLVTGNADLNTEVAHMASLTWVTQQRRFDFYVEAYNGVLLDAIERIEVQPNVFSFRNDSRARVQGAFAQFKYSLTDNLQLDMRANYADTEDRSGDPLNNQAASYLALDLRRSFGQQSVLVGLAHRFRLTDVSAGDQDLDSATDINVSWHKALTDSWNISIELQNLLDESYVLTTDSRATLAPGRAMNVSITRHIR